MYLVSVNETNVIKSKVTQQEEKKLYPEAMFV